MISGTSKSVSAALAASMSSCHDPKGAQPPEPVQSESTGEISLMEVRPSCVISPSAACSASETQAKRSNDLKDIRRVASMLRASSVFKQNNVGACKVPHTIVHETLLHACGHTVSHDPPLLLPTHKVPTPPNPSSTLIETHGHAQGPMQGQHKTRQDKTRQGNTAIETKKTRRTAQTLDETFLSRLNVFSVSRPKNNFR